MGDTLQSSNELAIVNTKYNFENKIEGNYYNTYLNGNLIITISVENIFDNRQNLYLFANNLAGNVSNFSQAKLYSCKIYNNSILVRDFIPCYRKADNKPGLYDVINDVFYTNAGTGEFNVGGNV
jgi:hypothetical protein